MNISNVFKSMALIAVLFALAGTPAAYGVEPEQSLVRYEVTKRDSHGRVQIMVTRTTKGTCMAEVTYEGTPRIYVVVISPKRLENLGSLLIKDGTEDNLTDEVLMEDFKKAMGERCLPLIVPGYAEV